MSLIESCRTCGSVITDDGCACAALATPGALTREQVEKACCRFLVDVRAEFRADVQAVADHDAAQRETIEHLIFERDRLERERAEWKACYRAAVLRAELDLLPQLAQLQATLAEREQVITGYQHSNEILLQQHQDRIAERDAFKAQCTCMYCGTHHLNISICSKCTFTKPAAEPFKLKAVEQQLDALAAQARELAQALTQCLGAMSFARRHIGDEGMRHWPDDPAFELGVSSYEAAQRQAQAVLEAQGRA